MSSTFCMLNSAIKIKHVSSSPSQNHLSKLTHTVILSHNVEHPNQPTVLFNQGAFPNHLQQHHCNIWVEIQPYGPNTETKHTTNCLNTRRATAHRQCAQIGRDRKTCPVLQEQYIYFLYNSQIYNEQQCFIAEERCSEFKIHLHCLLIYLTWAILGNAVLPFELGSKALKEGWTHGKGFTLGGPFLKDAVSFYFEFQLNECCQVANNHRLFLYSWQTKSYNPLQSTVCTYW